jgi:hypothetical protein
MQLLIETTRISVLGGLIGAALMPGDAETRTEQGQPVGGRLPTAGDTTAARAQEATSAPCKSREGREAPYALARASRAPRTAQARAISGIAPSAATGSPMRMRSRSAARCSSLRDIA